MPAMPAPPRVVVPTQIYNVEEIAALLRVEKRWVQVQFRERHLRGRRVGKGWQTTGRLLLEFMESGLPPLPDHRALM
jgi:hypothetical protein